MGADEYYRLISQAVAAATSCADYGFRNSSGTLAICAAIRRAFSLVSSFAADRRPWLNREYTEVWPGVCPSIALVSSECLRSVLSGQGAIIMKQRVIRTASLSLFFLLSGFAPVHAQVSSPESTEPPSRLSMFAHDVSNWLDHIITDAKHIITDADHINTDADHISTDADHVSTGTDHHRVTHSPPLPRPRPAELVSAPVASKEKTPMPIQIND